MNKKNKSDRDPHGRIQLQEGWEYKIRNKYKKSQCATERVFGSVIAVAFQIAFCAEKHVNNVFSFFKNHFWYQHIKTIQKIQTTLNFSKKKKKKLKNNKQPVAPQCQTGTEWKMNSRWEIVASSWDNCREKKNIYYMAGNMPKLVTRNYFLNNFLY